MAAAAVFGLYTFRRLQTHTSIVERNQLNDFSVLSVHCAHVSPIAASQFQQRQNKLAQTLYELGAAAYIAEPGPNAQYYANISLSDWWLSERPFLVVITPEVAHASMAADKPEVEAKVTIITPRFEAARASLLHIPTPDTQSDVIFAEWAEDGNPYELVTDIIATLRSTAYKPTQVLVDEGTRFFVVDGIVTAVSKHGYQVHNTPPEVAAIRERKTKEEIEILRCANEVCRVIAGEYRRTPYAPSFRSHYKPFDLFKVRCTSVYVSLRHGPWFVLHLQPLDWRMSTALFSLEVIIWYHRASQGLMSPSTENASLPHGSGTDRILTRNDLILFDIGGSLHGYYSDLTRTFALPDSHIPTQALEKWFLVQTAQKVAARTAREGALASDVDAAARKVIVQKGLGKWFTHRLGHGQWSMEP